MYKNLDRSLLLLDLLDLDLERLLVELLLLLLSFLRERDLDLELLRDELEYLLPLLLSRVLEDLERDLFFRPLRPRLRDRDEDELELEELRDLRDLLFLDLDLLRDFLEELDFGFD